MCKCTPEIRTPFCGRGDCQQPGKKPEGARNNQDHERIYLQPVCCADGDGRQWCEHDEPEECEEGTPWTEYVRADLVAAPVNQSLEAFIAEKHFINHELMDARDDLRAVMASDLESWMTDHVRVPVDSLERLRNLLLLGKCPDCNGSGAYYDNMGGVCQCQWCYERDAALNASKGE